MKRPALKNFRRIVVKVGSSLLVDSDAGEVRASWLAALAADIAKLHGEGREILVVSSGSIALGRSRLKLPRGTLKLEESQGAAGGGAGIGLTRPFDGKPMTVGNGVMVALAARDKAQVDRIYKLALSLGGTDEGPPGPRGEGGFYAAYFRDPDGNKLNAFVMG